MAKMEITYSERYLAEGFAEKIVGNIDSKDFMDSKNARRSNQKVLEDNVKGKIAEIAVANYIWQATKIKSKMDFEIYEMGIGDDFDIIANGVSIDVKASSPRARCLMVEYKKRRSWDMLGCPDYLCMVSAEMNEAHYLFGIPFSEFEERAILYRRGDSIPNTNFPLKADNYIITADECYGHAHLAEYVTNSKK
jgi:hypothetical protein